MRKTVKTAIGIILALVLTIGVIPPAPAKAEFFADMVIDGVTYYDLLGSTQSYFSSGFDQFVQQYLTTRPGFGNYSVQEKWAEVARAIVEAAQQNDSNTHNDWYTAKQELDLSTFGDTAQSGFGIAGSQYGEVEAMGVAFQQIQEKSGKEHNFYPTKDGEITTLLGMDPGLCMYYWRLGDNNSGQKLYDSVAIVFSNFRFAHVVNGEYIQNNVMSRQDYSLNLGEPTTTYSDVYTNNTAQTAQVSSGLKTDVTESVTMSQSHTETFNYGASVTVSTELSFGTGQDWFAGAQWKIGVSATASWSAALSDNFGSSKTYTNTGGSTSTISAALPPYTEARILKSVGEGKMALKFDMPTMLLYDVSICFPPITDMNRPRYVCYTTYKTSADRNSANAREDLHQRVLNHASEPQDVHNDDDYLRTWAGMVWEKVPVSKAVVDMGYTINYSDSNLSDIRPIANLKKVEMKDKRSAMDLKVGEPLDVSTVEVVGLNEMNNPFYGFDDALGSWSLLDENGDPIPDNKNQYIKLEEDAVTKRVMLTALQPGGTVFLHYNVPDNTYVDVERTAAGASAAETFYTHPEDVKNLATLTVHTVTTSESYKITAEGEVAGYVGDTPVALNGEDSPVTACVLDANGNETDKPVTWAVRKDNGVIAIDGENNLSFLKEGQNAIRAEWGSLHSEWLPVTVNAARQVATVTLSDPKGILEDWHFGDGASSRTYETRDLTFTCLDQYGNTMDEIPGRPIWDIRKDGQLFISFGDPDHFLLDSAGEYGVTVTVNRVESNMLTFNIGAPAALTVLALSDDPDEPYLADYCLHDRPDDTFDLTQLTVEGRDQYGEPTAFDPTGLTWLVNGNALEGSTLTVREAGTYNIQCQTGDEAALQSNILKLKVLPTSYHDNLSVVTLPKASAITYGQALADSTLTGGVVRLEGAVVPGTFVWRDDQIEPAVSDSRKTAYDAVFMPEQPDKYGTAACAVRLTVNKAASSVEAPPTAVSNLSFKDKPQALIVAGAAKGGEMVYAIGEDDETAPSGGWTTAIPTGIDAGTYDVWYKVVGDENHEDTEAGCVSVEIQVAASKNTAPNAKDRVFDGSGQPLVNAGSVEGGTLYYALGSDAVTPPETGWSTAVPTATDAGTYYVWYKVTGDENHNDVAPACVVVTIREAEQTAAPVSDYTLLATLRTSGKKALKLGWTGVEGAEGYDVYFGGCNTGECQYLASVSGQSYKIDHLKAGSAFKAYVMAWKNVGGAKTYIGEASPDVHAIVGGKSNKYTNPKSIGVKKRKLTLTVGESKTVKAKLQKVSNRRKYLNHVSAKLRYYSSDHTVATVDEKGRVTGVGAGQCMVYAVAENGLRAGVKITVK